MNYSVEQIANYIEENVSLSSNESIDLWEGPNGLTHTRGSMEYRDEDHQRILVFRTMDEVPEGDDLINSVKFQLNQQML